MVTPSLAHTRVLWERPWRRAGYYASDANGDALASPYTGAVGETVAQAGYYASDANGDALAGPYGCCGRDRQAGYYASDANGDALASPYTGAVGETVAQAGYYASDANGDASAHTRVLWERPWRRLATTHPTLMVTPSLGPYTGAVGETVAQAGTTHPTPMVRLASPYTGAVGETVAQLATTHPTLMVTPAAHTRVLWENRGAGWLLRIRR